MIKESIHKKYIAIINIYAPDNRTPKYMGQKLIKMKEETNNQQ